MTMTPRRRWLASMIAASTQPLPQLPWQRQTVPPLTAQRPAAAARR